ncbi:MAG: hypothetical protein ACREAE_05590 [Nitrosopumilaceae archaeon]
MWCSPYFGSGFDHNHEYTNPPSSRPSEIFRELCEVVHNGDKHSAKINENKLGILKGADDKKKAGVINNRQKKDIAAIVQSAEISDFRPLLYVIPFICVSKIVKEVPVPKRAHPLSVEYIIKRLPRRYFDVIDLDRR